ncbi:hypothetical protein [Microbispora sp. GKU 823]|uniref:hypothetical protein n=1 Tax=Microbispora sp. GKU 823 TaxID=1652100 RepID=UPI0009A340A8|nr:hypothetical protein [Microbispora sp. GKU 823]OPG12220.1 hypothetical protein B1L11_15325 [Microbispora sp. GKU 823]
MTATDLTPQEAARWALRAGLPLGHERHAEVAATAQHIHNIIGILRELDFGDAPPAAVYCPGSSTPPGTGTSPETGNRWGTGDPSTPRDGHDWLYGSQAKATRGREQTDAAV